MVWYFSAIQTSVSRGPDLTFVDEANSTRSRPKPSSCWVIKLMDRTRDERSPIKLSCACSQKWYTSILLVIRRSLVPFKPPLYFNVSGPDFLTIWFYLFVDLFFNAISQVNLSIFWVKWAAQILLKLNFTFLWGLILPIKKLETTRNSGQIISFQIILFSFQNFQFFTNCQLGATKFFFLDFPVKLENQNFLTHFSKKKF